MVRWNAGGKRAASNQEEAASNQEEAMTQYKTALIVGTGSGLSASLARLFAKEGMKVAVAARGAGNLEALAKETGARAFACDATQRSEVAKLFSELKEVFGDPDVVIYNASYRTRGPFISLDPDEVEKSLAVTAFGGFLVAQEATRRMLPHGHGAILFTGASASVKGYAQSAPFAMGKFALRGLAQSMARELSPHGIHIGHIVIDGAIRSQSRPVPPDKPDSMLDPDAIAENYLHLLQQPRSTWAWEIELRPWVEKF
jgi:NAD(P)-dependent dehydrogenase (short-subunit alcohol dehydrogenase family)